MKENKSVVVVLILATLFLVLLKTSFLKIDVDQIQGHKGKISINRMEDHRALALDGEWEFYWNQLIDPPQFSEVKGAELDYFKVPQLWKGNTYRGEFSRGNWGRYLSIIF